MPRISRRRFLQLAGSGLLVAQSPYLLAQPTKKKLGIALLGERLTLPRLASLCLGIGGLAVVLGGGPGRPWPRNLGDWLALGAGGQRRALCAGRPRLLSLLGSDERDTGSGRGRAPSCDRCADAGWRGQSACVAGRATFGG